MAIRDMEGYVRRLTEEAEDDWNITRLRSTAEKLLGLFLSVQYMCMILLLDLH
ncbi:hypothetical protein F5880DRAFT_1700957 [Lentinula raphanica]|nr:hypothetical protein F5880DRAFT_1700957 [Lentinula raphanica]